MKNLLFVIALLIMSFSISQDRTKDSIALEKKTSTSEEVAKRIDSIIISNNSDVEEIKNIAKANQQKINNIKVLDSKQDKLVDKILNQLKSNKKAPVQKPIIKYEVVVDTILVNAKKDSLCKEFQRLPSLNEFKCLSWVPLQNND